MPFGNIGPLELLIVLGIALLIFGPKRLPGAGKALGQGIREFKDSIGRRSDDEDDDDKRELPRTARAQDDEREPAATKAAASPAEPDPVARD